MSKTKNQSSFTLLNARLRAGKADSTGFIPMLIMIVLFLAALIWFVFRRVIQSGH